ncbi:MAG: translation initiation factor IF-3 [Deltaproteobacteria bacterium]|nr:translation initiation factor IF-3 [Deltaproteobacteria bacterium]
MRRPRKTAQNGEASDEFDEDRRGELATKPKKGGRKDDRKKNEQRVDRRIRVPEVLVIDADGRSLGVLATKDAMRMAQEQGLNLVEVAPNARPPVCRILDYGKFKYDLKKTEAKKRRNQVVVEIKEVKFRPKVDKHDFETKLRHVSRFLSDGDKVKCTIMFRGREMAHPDLGEVVLKRVLEQLKDKIVIENPPKMEGRNMHMQIGPKPGAWPKKEKPKTEDGQEVEESAEDDDLDEDLDEDLDDEDEDEDEDDSQEAGVPEPT